MFYHNLITYYIKIWYCRYGCNTCRCISSVWDVNSELPHLIVFSSREILQLICFDDSTADYYFITCIVSVTIKLRISRWFLLRDRFASFISLSPALHLFTIRARFYRRKRVVCYNVFSLFGRRGRWMETSHGIAICTERVMHICRQEEKITAIRSIALEASTRQIYHVSTYIEINPVWIIL